MPKDKQEKIQYLNHKIYNYNQKIGKAKKRKQSCSKLRSLRDEAQIELRNVYKSFNKSWWQFWK